MELRINVEDLGVLITDRFMKEKYYARIERALNVIENVIENEMPIDMQNIRQILKGEA